MQKLPDRFDPARLRRLLDIVGPDEAGGFLAQLDRDLTGCATGIALACDRQDWATLREASHVLISLAGSAGALALQDMAETLNAAAHARDAARTTQLCADLAPDLAALVALVRATPDPFVSPG